MCAVGIVCLSVSVFLCHSFAGVSTRPWYPSHRPKDNDALALFGRQRTSQCSEYGGVCYSNGYCCKNAICLRQGNQEDVLLLLGGRPAAAAAAAAAGRCVAEAELDRCETDADCRWDCSCVEAGRRRGRRFCIPKTTKTTRKTTKSEEEGEDVEEQDEEGEEGEGETKFLLRRPTEKMMTTTTTNDYNQNRRWKSFFKTIGGFGSYCETSAECLQMVDQGGAGGGGGGEGPLCCQLVRRGRQIPRRMCDYRTPISFCIQ